MATSSKSLQIAKEIASELKLRQSALAVTESFDTDGNPLVRLGTGANGAAGALLKVQPYEMVAKNVLGLDADVFSPSVIKVNVEANPAGGSGADINTWAIQALVVGCAFTRGAKVEVYVSTAGTAPNATDIDDPAKLVAAWEPNPCFPLVSNS